MGVLADWQIRRDIGIEPFAESQKIPGGISFGCGSYGYDVRIGYKFKVFSPINCNEIDPKNFDPKALVEVDLTPHPKHEWESRFTNSITRTEYYECKLCKQQFYVRNIPNDYKTNYCGNEQKPNFIRIPPHSFVLGESIETFTIPRDVLCVVMGKSTYARCGLIVNVTPGEPEWNGKWTIEISNTTPLPARVYCNEGIMQAFFLRSDGYVEMLLEQHGISRETEGMKDFTCDKSYADKKGKYQNQTELTLPKSD